MRDTGHHFAHRIDAQDVGEFGLFATQCHFSPFALEIRAIQHMADPPNQH